MPVAVVATDLVSGERVVLSHGSAAEAAYASSALAGILPPLTRYGMLVADDAYVDIAAVDVARDLVPDSVLAVDSGSKRDAVAAGVRAVRSHRATLAHLLEAASPAPGFGERSALATARLDG